jgi:hypothetical protein
MTALAGLQAGIGPAFQHDSILDFLRFGWHDLGPVLHRDAANGFLQAVLARRAFGPDMFLSETAFDAQPVATGLVDLVRQRSLLDDLPALTVLVDQNPLICEALAALLGPGWKVLSRYVVCGVPQSWMPAWLMRRIAGAPANSPGLFVRPEWRDVAYFYDIDFHQDLIDHPHRMSDFITLSVNLHDVGPECAPTQVLPGSHSLGADVFPHHLVRCEAGDWIYSDRRGQRVRAPLEVLTGVAGSAAMWHACMLQRSRPVTAATPRICLRYLIARGDAAITGLDLVNASLRGPASHATLLRPAGATGEVR